MKGISKMCDFKVNLKSHIFYNYQHRVDNCYYFVEMWDQCCKFIGHLI